MSRLAFPAGVAPGFDPSHAALAGGTCRFSGAALGGGYVNLLSGLPGTKVSSPVSMIDGTVGPAITCNGASHSYTFANQSTVVDASVTFAGFVTVLATPSNSCIIANSNAASGARLLLISATTVGVDFPGGGTLADSNAVFTFTTGRPYFVIASHSVAASQLNTAVCDLLTGRVIGDTRTRASTGQIAPNGTYRIGNATGGSNSATGNVASVAYVNNFLHARNLGQLAFDPWPLWYPQR